MATFKDREVFEFCEKTFEELKRQDNGYFPNKHDKEVFNRASAQFGIGVEEVDKIYDSYTKVAAQLEIMKINRLPKKKRKAAMMRKMQDIVLNNKDLPFYKIEGEPQEPIVPATDIIEEGYKELISTLAHAGWTIPLTIDIQQLRTSPLASIVLMDSFSNRTGMFMSLSCRMYFRQSSVFLANRLMDLVIIISMLPALQSSIM